MRHLMSICAPIQMMSHLFSFLALIHIPHMYRILPECFHFEAHLNSYLCLFPQPRLSHLYRSFLLPPSSTPQLNTTPSLIPSLGRLEHSSQHHGQKECHREHWKFQPIVAKHFSSIQNSNRKSKSIFGAFQNG